MKYIIDEKLMDKIIEYLSNRPWIEVFDIMEMLKSVNEIKEE